jgi:hypothetical protein
MSYELEGLLHKIYPTESKSGTFQTREFVVKMEGQYPQFVKLQLVQDRCGILDNHAEGSRVKVSFDLRGREWQDKYFTTLNAWRIEQQGNPVQESAIHHNDEMPPFQSDDSIDSGLPTEFNDLPF